MAPLKFEEQCKEKLEKRTIAPSDAAWERLSAQLETQKKKRKPGIWLGIAAGFIGILIVSVLYFSTGNPDEVLEDAVVDRPVPSLNKEEPAVLVEAELVKPEEDKTVTKEAVLKEVNKADKNLSLIHI